MKKRIKAFLCRLFPRFKLRCILRALGLSPVQWQMDYALGRSNKFRHSGRASGKTVAIMLRALMQSPSVDTLEHIIAADPDYLRGNRHREWVFRSEYDRYQQRCSEAGIPVPKMRSKTLTGRDNWWTT